MLNGCDSFKPSWWCKTYKYTSWSRCQPTVLFDIPIDIYFEPNEKHRDTKTYAPHNIIHRMCNQFTYPIEFSHVWITNKDGNTSKSKWGNSIMIWLTSDLYKDHIKDFLLGDRGFPHIYAHDKVVIKNINNAV